MTGDNVKLRVRDILINRITIICCTLQLQITTYLPNANKFNVYFKVQRLQTRRREETDRTGDHMSNRITKLCQPVLVLLLPRPDAYNSKGSRSVFS